MRFIEFLPVLVYRSRLCERAIYCILRSLFARPTIDGLTLLEHGYIHGSHQAVSFPLNKVQPLVRYLHAAIRLPNFQAEFYTSKPFVGWRLTSTNEEVWLHTPALGTS